MAIIIVVLIKCYIHNMSNEINGKMCIMLQVNMSGFGRNVNEVAWRSTDSNVGR